MILLLEPKERIGLPTTLIRLPRRQCLAERGLAWWALVQCAIGVLATSAAFGLYVYQQLSGGPQQVLLLSLVRFAFLLLVGVLTYKAFGHQQADGLSRLSRTALCQAAIFAQLLWFTSELVLGSALLAFLPLVQGQHTDLVLVNQASSLVYHVVAIVYLAGMTGCLCFLSSIARRRRRSETVGSSTSAGSCTSRGGKDSSPVSEAGSFSSGSSALFYPRSGAASPSGPLPGASIPTGAHCDIVLVEHEVSGSPDGRGLFVHKALRPIRTKPEERPYIPLLKPIISNSFSFQDGSAMAAAVRSSVGVQQSGGSFNFNSSNSGMQRMV